LPQRGTVLPVLSANTYQAVARFEKGAKLANVIEAFHVHGSKIDSIDARSWKLVAADAGVRLSENTEAFSATVATVAELLRDREECDARVRNEGIQLYIHTLTI
jgi:hypothetical protein